MGSRICWAESPYLTSAQVFGYAVSCSDAWHVSCAQFLSLFLKICYHLTFHILVFIYTWAFLWLCCLGFSVSISLLAGLDRAKGWWPMCEGFDQATAAAWYSASGSPQIRMNWSHWQVDSSATGPHWEAHQPFNAENLAARPQWFLVMATFLALAESQGVRIFCWWRLHGVLTWRWRALVRWGGDGKDMVNSGPREWVMHHLPQQSQGKGPAAHRTV